MPLTYHITRLTLWWTTIHDVWKNPHSDHMYSWKDLYGVLSVSVGNQDRNKLLQTSWFIQCFFLKKNDEMMHNNEAEANIRRNFESIIRLNLYIDSRRKSHAYLSLGWMGKWEGLRLKSDGKRPTQPFHDLCHYNSLRDIGSTRILTPPVSGDVVLHRSSSKGIFLGMKRTSEVVDPFRE